MDKSKGERTPNQTSIVKVEVAKTLSLDEVDRLGRKLAKVLDVPSEELIISVTLAREEHECGPACHPLLRG